MWVFFRVHFDDRSYLLRSLLERDPALNLGRDFKMTRSIVFLVLSFENLPSVSKLICRGEEWGKAIGENCYSETEPIWKEGYHGRESNPRLDQMVETTINNLKTRGLKIQTIDITQLSEYRKDAHTLIYQRMWNRLTKEQLTNPKTYADCVNWCVPDVWNELLYAYIFHF